MTIRFCRRRLVQRGRHGVEELNNFQAFMTENWKTQALSYCIVAVQVLAFCCWD